MTKVMIRIRTFSSSVFDDLTDISCEWVGLERLVKVERIGTRAGKTYEQVAPSFFYHHNELALSREGRNKKSISSKPLAN